ncbi:MAG: S1C family serine protease [Thermoleophilia bacterium]
MATGNQTRLYRIFIAITLLSLLLALAGCGTSASNQTTVVTSAAGDEIEAVTGDFEHAISVVSQQVKPAVVQITGQQTQSGQFNQPFTVPTGVGSGIIYDKSGLVLTNNHVVQGAQSLLVSLPDGRSFQGQLVGGDAQTDIAVVKLQGDNLNLPVAPLGDSNYLQVGDWVVAIGNALALSGGPTVTKGVISALGRAVQEPGDTSTTQGPFLFNVIQTDAPINPGNSGGPLVSLNGEVMGINTLVAGSDTSGATTQGIGFAISTATAKPIADQLVASGKVVHPYVGVSYTPLDAFTASHLGITGTTDGALVTQVAMGSPADGAGIQTRDVITAVDGTAIVGDSAFAQIISSHKPGDTVSMTVLRGTDKLTMQVTLATMPG